MLLYRRLLQLSGEDAAVQKAGIAFKRGCCYTEGWSSSQGRMLLFRRLVQLSRANLNSRASCESVNPLLGIHLCGKLQDNLIARRKVLQAGMIAKTLVKKA